MRRREFITLVAGATAWWPVAARAQQRAMPSVGFLFATSPDTNADRMRGFHRGLKETGYVEGENVAIIISLGGGPIDRLPALATELVGRQVAVIVAAGEVPRRRRSS